MVRNQENFLVLMQNYGTALDYAETSMKSSGTAMQKFSVYQEGIEAKTNSMIAAFEELSLALVNSDLVKWFVDFGRGAAEATTFVIKLVGALPTLASALSGILTIAGKGGGIFGVNKDTGSLTSSFGDLKNLASYITSFKSASSTIQEYNKYVGKSYVLGESFFNSIKSGNKRLGEYLQGLNGAKASMNGYSEALSLTTAKSIAATVAATALNMAITMGVSFIISSAIGVIQDLAQAQEKARQKAIDLNEAFKTQSETIKSNISTLQGLEDEFKSLANGVDDYGRNIALSTDEYSRYKEIVSQILGISSELVSGYDEEGNAIAKKNGLIEESIKLMEEEYRLRLLENTSTEQISTLGESYINDLKELEDKAPDFGKVGEKILNAFTEAMQDNRNVRELDIMQLLGLGDKALNYQNEFGSFIRDYYDEISNVILNEQEKLSAILSVDQIQMLQNAVVEYGKEVSVFEKSVSKAQQALNPTLQLVPQTLTAYQTLTDAQKSFITQYINGFRIAKNTTDEDLADMKQSILNFVDDLAGNEDALNIVNKMFNIDKSSMNASEYVEAIKALIAQLQSEIDLDEDTILKIKLAFNLDNGENSDDNIEHMLQSIADNYHMSTSNIKFSVEELSVAFQKLKEDGTLTWTELQKAVSDSGAFDSIETLSNVLNDFNDQISNLYSNYDILNQALDDFAEMGAISANTFKAITDNNLWEYVQVTADGVNILTGELLNNEAATREAAKTHLQLALADELMKIAAQGASDAEVAVGNAAASASGNIAMAANVVQILGNNSSVSAGQVNELNVALGGIGLDWSTQQGQINQVVSSYQNAVKAIDSITYSSNSASNAFGGYSGAAKGAGSASSAAAKEVDELTEALKAQKEALEATKSALEDQKSAYDGALKAIKKLLDAEIDGIKDAISAIDDELDELEKNRDSVLAAINYQIDKEIDILQDAYDALSDLDDPTSYGARIQALKDTADAEAKLLAVEKARAAWEQANSQKTSRVYSHDEGFTWQKDEDAAYQALQDLESAERDKQIYDLEQALAAEQAALKKQIDALQEYKDAYADFVKEQEIQTDLEIATLILGSDWQSLILTNREALFDSYTDHYLETQARINDLTAEKEAHEARIAMLEAIKAKWDEVSSAYEDAQNRQHAANLLGADWEKKVLSGRVDVLNKFKNDYIRIQEEMEAVLKRIQEIQAQIDAAQKAVNSSSGGSGGSSGGSGSTPTTSTPRYRIVNYKTGAVYQEGFTSRADANAVLDKIYDKSSYTVKEYAKGTKGTLWDQLALINELGDELVIPPSLNKSQKGNYQVLQKGTGVLPATMTEKMMDMTNHYNPVTHMLGETSASINNITPISKSDVISIGSLGPFHLHGVQNVESFADAINANLHNALLQRMGKK